MKTKQSANLALKLSALAGAAGIAPAAHAAVIASPTLPLTPPSSLGITFWDIDGSGLDSKFKLQNSLIQASLRGLGGASLVFNGNKLSNLNAGVTVGPALAFRNRLTVTSVGGVAGTAAKFAKNTPGYFGFKFTGSNNTTEYGWGTLLITGTTPSTRGQGFTIQNAYYDNTGAAITVGAVPEPSSVALLALGATGLAAWRLRKKTAEKAA